ncbi:MAG: hypothetical protein EBW87_00240 [Burkholderiaceae bacterium]|nr:hypothetical protein [Burkholderiaceae bacterium]
MASQTQQLENPSPPALGYPTEVYERRHFNENNSALNIYFRKLTSVLGSLFGPRGGRFMNNPYGAFQDSTDQTAANTTTAYAVTLNTTDFSNGVTLASGSRITVADAGIWNCQFSIQFKNTTNDTQDVDVWFRLNGTNIDNSNSRFSMPARKSSGDPSHLIAAMNFFASMDSTDYLEIMWRPSDVGVSIEHYGTSTSPTRPAVPSAIVTMSFVSNIT